MTEPVPARPAEFETADRLHLHDEYETTLDRFFEHVQHAMTQKRVTFPEARAAMRLTLPDDVADAFEEWWGADDA